MHASFSESGTGTAGKDLRLHQDPRGSVSEEPQKGAKDRARGTTLPTKVEQPFTGGVKIPLSNLISELIHLNSHPLSPVVRVFQTHPRAVG